MHEAVWGFHIKTSPCFKDKLGFIELLNPERELNHVSSSLFFFFLDVSLCLGGNLFFFLKHLCIHQALGVGSKSETERF